MDGGSASACASHFRPDLGILATWSGRVAESHSPSECAKLYGNGGP